MENVTTVSDMDAPEEVPEQEETTDSDIPEYRLTQNPDFKMIYVNGVFGNLTPIEGRMTFYVDRLFPKIIDEKGTMRTDHVDRELQIELKMSPAEFVAIHKWMTDWIEKLKISEVITSTEPETDE